ncbi:MAG: cation:proton antiporter [Pseudobdellovibrionaceae bacterium]|mgnify:CR=1 FL=1|nr:cation:proton antiporter [Bdellovibrionales bacterium]USN47161.1 MAG: cation:proton antiporter [Pseudobdellovibrionaceae bacterium]
MAHVIISLAALFFLGHVLNWFFIKTKIPDLLLLVGLGFVIGPVLGFVTPADLGEVGAVLATVALIVILYEGGLHLSTDDLKSSSLPAAGLSVLGFLLVVGTVTLIAKALSFESWRLCLLLGIGLGSTSSAIVIPMVKPLSINDRTKTVLSLESAFTDVLTIVTFLVILESIVKNQFSVQQLIVGIGPKTVLAGLMGLGFGLLWSFVKKRFSEWIPKAFAGEAFALLTYGLIEASGHNGAIGVLVLGFTLANLQLLPEWMKDMMSKKPVSYQEQTLLSEITFLLRTFFFLYLGTLVKFSNFSTVGIAIVVTLVLFALRYVTLRILFGKNHLSRLDAMVVTAMGPRGLACAVLATLPLQPKFYVPNGQWLQDIIFAVIPLTILITAILVSLSENVAFRNRMGSMFGLYPESATEKDLEVTA